MHKTGEDTAGKGWEGNQEQSQNDYKSTDGAAGRGGGKKQQLKEVQKGGTPQKK